MRKKWSSIFLFSIIAICCNAQTAGYKFYSLLDSVKTSGFYNIELTPELNAHLKTDYSDFRVVNDSGKWVPHQLWFPGNKISADVLKWDLHYTKTEDTKLNTTLLIEAEKKTISNICLVIKNTEAERFCTLSGSDDKSSWFVINDSIKISPVANQKTVENTFKINFPPNNYKFYKVVILNNNKDPFAINGVVNESVADLPVYFKLKLISNPQPSIVQKDSSKISYIKITQQLPYHFDKISLQLSGVKYFFRKVDLYIPASNDHSFTNPGQLLQSFTISNNSTLQFGIPLSNAPVFYLLINNDDNLPLKVTSINTAFNERYITTYLENGDEYRLIMGNTAATPPNYDLANIKTNFPDTIPFLSFQKIIPFTETPTIAVVTKNNNWILWSAIAIVLFILLLFTKKMVKEVDKRKEHDHL